MTEPWEDPMGEVDDIAERARANAMNFEAVLISFRKDKNGINIVLTVSPHDVPEQLMLAPVGARYQIAAVRLDDNEQPLVPPKSEGELAVMRAGILCQEEEFQAWLVKGGYAVSANEEAAKKAIYHVCGISTRKELRSNPSAQLTFKKLVDLYEEHLLKTGDKR
jgi:hypothetical protein